MKHLPYLFFLAAFLMCTHALNAQQVPSGINYQAVLRNREGQIIENKQINIQISVSDPQTEERFYMENHTVRTNGAGIFSLVVGEGKAVSGRFGDIPWSSKNTWLEVAYDLENDGKYEITGSTRLLSVPYAFYAEKAGSTLEKGGQHGGAEGDDLNGEEAWLLKGNMTVDDTYMFLGTLNYADLVIKTHDKERIRITKGMAADQHDALINLQEDVTADKSVTILETLTVGKSALLNDELIVVGNTAVGGNLDVTGNATVGGTMAIAKQLDVHENVVIDGGLNVQEDGAFEQNLKIDRNLYVYEDLFLEGDFNAGGKGSFSDLTVENDLTVGQDVDIDRNLTVGGTVNVEGSNTGFLVTISNADADTGDGLAIKLGRTHPAWDGSDYLYIQSPAADAFDDAIDVVEGWVDDPNSFEPEDLLDLIPTAMLAGTACAMVNLLSDQLDDALSLPLDFPGWHILDETELFGGLDLSSISLPSIPELVIPELEVPEFTLIPSIPQINCGSLPNAFAMPNISFTNVNNSLSNDNQFLSFQDKEGRELGTIRAESITDWRTRYFNGVFVVNLVGTVTGFDLLSGITGTFAIFTNIVEAHNKLGVEYNSGHGDYAEWLERIDPKESIGTGDIVGVTGGKISKDLTRAEQVMAVSYRPIVLGNVPPPEREKDGNKVAFMGQIPVKVVGPVATGDYIVGKSSTPGYGVAVHPEDMSAEDIVRAVGRSWETNLNEGPKMVNTAVGIDNGYFLKLIKDSREQVKSLDARMNALEARINAGSR